MTFEDIAGASTVYVDANIFIYHFTGQSDECRSLLSRCQQMELQGTTGMHVILEVAHRIMMMEAVSKGVISGGNVPSRLKRRPELVGRLTDLHGWIHSIQDSNIIVLEPRLSTLESSLAWQRRYGLLVNDSVSAALMNEYDISTIATNDRDFERIQGLSVHTPGDL